MARRIQLRRDTASAWSAANPVLAQGEIGIDLTNNKIKIGTGTTAWNSLAYWDDKVTDLSSFAGNIVPDTDNTRSLGSPTKQWKDIFVSNGSVYIGDIKLSNDAGTLKVQQVTDAGTVDEEPVPDAPGVVTTDRLVNGVNTFTLNDEGYIDLPGDGKLGAINNSILGLSSQQNRPIFIEIIDTEGESPVVKQWEFNKDGSLTLPDGITINRDADGFISPTESNQIVGLKSHSGLARYDIYGDTARVRTWSEGFENEKTWVFDQDGILTLPPNGDIKDSNGDSVLGGGGAANLGDFEIIDSTLKTVDPGMTIDIQTRVYTEGGEPPLSSSVQLNPEDGIAKLTARQELEQAFNNSAWTSAQWTIVNGSTGRVQITGSTVMYEFISQRIGKIENIRFTVNGNGPFDFNGTSYSPNGSFTMITGATLPPANPTTVTYINLFYNNRAFVDINYSDGAIAIDGGVDLPVNLNTDQYVGIYGKNSVEISSPNYAQIQSGENYIWVEDDNGAYIETGEGKQWQFNYGGVIRLPQDGDIVDNNGNSVIRNITSQEDVKVTVGNNDYWALVHRNNPNEEGDSNSGVEGTAVCYDNQGNLYMLHVAVVYDYQINNHINKLMISKINSFGAVIWQKQIQDNIDNDTSHDIAWNADDNSVIVAVTNDDGMSLDDDLVLMKLNSGGGIQWQKEYHPAVPVPTDQGVTPTSNTIGTGIFNGNPAQYITVSGEVNFRGDTAGWSFRELTNGNPSATLGTTVAASYDSQANETTIYFDPGTFSDPLDTGAHGYDLYKVVGRSWLEVGSVVVKNGNIYVAGWYEENQPNNSVNNQGFLMKATITDGTLGWFKAFDFTGETEVFGMEADADGNIVVVGRLYADGGPVPQINFTTKFNGVTGSAFWTHIFTPEDMSGDDQFTGSDVTCDGQGNIYVSVNATKRIMYQNPGNNTQINVIAHIYKLNTNGAVQWTRIVGPGPCASVATGIDCDSDGNVYLSAVTVAQNNPVRDVFEGYITAKNVLAVAKYDSYGTVLWQRYVEAAGYDVYADRDNGNNGSGDYDYSYNRGRNLAINSDGKIAIQVAARQRDTDNQNTQKQLWEAITFQIAQDGRLLDVGSGAARFKVLESRIPGKFVTLAGQLVQDPAIAVLGSVEPVETQNPNFSLATAQVAVELSHSEAYVYRFGNDGTLTIPNDGDLKLTQSQQGWFSLIGPVKNSDDDRTVFAQCVDNLSGDVYVVGEAEDVSRGFMLRYNNAGEILWGIQFIENGDGYDSRAVAVRMRPETGNVVVLLKVYGPSTTWAVLVEVDPNTARVTNSLAFRDLGNEGSVDPYDFTFGTGDEVIVAGGKWDEFRTVAVTPQAGSGVGTLVVLKSVLGDQSPQANGGSSGWYISGTGITGRSPTGATVTDSGSTWTIQDVAGIDYSGPGSWNLIYDLGEEGFVAKLDDTGGIMWTKTVGVGGVADNEYFSSVAIDLNGNVYAVGRMKGSNGNAGNDLDSYDLATITKFDQMGNAVWHRVLNDTIDNCWATSVATYSNHIAVTHFNDDSGMTIITKIDTAGNVLWQKKTQGNNDESAVAVDSNGDVYAVVQFNSESSLNDAIKLMRFNSQGELVYRKIFGTGVGERVPQGRAISLRGDDVYIAGISYAFYDDYKNGFLIKLPKSLDIDGSYNAWTVMTDLYTVDTPQDPEARGLTPLVAQGEFEGTGSDFGSDYYDPSDANYYHTFSQILDRDGGNIVFADGTTQNRSAQTIPQTKLRNGQDHILSLEDSGGHILITNSDTNIIVPYNNDRALPIGYTVVLVNDTSGTINVDASGGGMTLRNGSNSGSYWDLQAWGMATLLKVDENYWRISGDVQED